MAVNDTASTTRNSVVTISVLGNDTDPDNDRLSVTALTQPTNGKVTLNANGTVTYTPNRNYSGTDTFTYKARDGFAESNTATVTVTVSR